MRFCGIVAILLIVLCSGCGSGASSPAENKPLPVADSTPVSEPAITDFPASFRNDGFGSLEIKPFLPERAARSLNAEQLKSFRTAFHALERNPGDKQALIDAVHLLTNTRHYAEAIPYMERFLAHEGGFNTFGDENHVIGLCLLGRFDEAQKISDEVARRLPDSVGAKDIAEQLHLYRCLHACVVKNDLLAAARAFKALHDNFIIFLYPAPTDEADERLAQTFVAQCESGEIKTVLPELDFVYPYLTPPSAQKCLEALDSAGIKAPERLVAAADLFNQAQSAPPGAWMVRARFAEWVEKSRSDAAKLIQLGVNEARKLGEPRPLLYALNFQLNVCIEREDFVTAAQCIPDVLQAAKRIGPAALAESSTRIGRIYKMMGDLPRAIEHLQTANEIASGDAKTQQQVDFELIECRIATGQTEGLEAIAKEKLQFKGADQRYLSFWRYPIAECRMQAADYAAAAAIFRQLASSEYVPSFAQKYHERLGECLLKLHDLDGAAAAFDATGKDDAQRENPLGGWEWRYGQARVALARQDSEGAQHWLNEALTSIETQRASLADHRLRASLLDNKYDVFDFAIGLALDENKTAEAFNLAERARARAFLDGLGSSDLANASAPVCTLKQLEDLKTDATVLTFFQRRSELLVWITRNGETTLLRLPLKDTVVRDAVNAYYAAVQVADAPSDDGGRGISGISKSHLADERSGQDSLRLLTDFWSPVVKKLPTDGPICIIPHRFLHYVPFQALTSDGARLIDAHDIFYAPSASALLALNSRKQDRNGQLVVFDSLLSNAPDSPFHATESRALLAHDPQAKGFLQGEATLAVFRREATQAGILHVSAHGGADLAFPAHSALLLTPDVHDDGMLRADEIYGLHFTHTPLVVLSACYSSAGGLSEGDEVTGVTRAFLSAGAENVVGSLWPVDNAATTELMQQFYAELDKSPRDSVHALCQAQREIAKTLKRPALWAAFGVYGRGAAH